MRLGIFAVKYKISPIEVQACLKVNGLEIEPRLNLLLSDQHLKILNHVYDGINFNGISSIIQDKRIIRDAAIEIKNEIEHARILKMQEEKQRQEDEKKKYEEQMAKQQLERDLLRQKRKEQKSLEDPLAKKLLEQALKPQKQREHKLFEVRKQSSFHEEEQKEGEIYNTLSRFVTKSTANSVCFYTMAYLNYNLTPIQIAELRGKLSLNNFYTGKFNIEELKASFVNQSAYFLNIYLEMTNSDRFADFATNLEKQNRFEQIFRHYRDSQHLISCFNRRIYHSNLKCAAMLSDYDEDDVHYDNTGVFGEKLVKKYYVLEEKFLIKLKMTLCKKCNPSSPEFIL